ncbi:unnamed protein product, partial [Sphacelaria rigidula]
SPSYSNVVEPPFSRAGRFTAVLVGALATAPTTAFSLLGSPSTQATRPQTSRRHLQPHSLHPNGQSCKRRPVKRYTSITVRDAWTRRDCSRNVVELRYEVESKLQAASPAQDGLMVRGIPSSNACAWDSGGLHGAQVFASNKQGRGWGVGMSLRLSGASGGCAAWLPGRGGSKATPSTAAQGGKAPAVESKGEWFSLGSKQKATGPPAADSDGRGRG